MSARRQRDAPSFNRFRPSLASSPQAQSSPAAPPDTRPSVPVVNGIPLVNLRQTLPDKFRAIFPYELLNAVQSKCFDVVYRTNDNVVVAAPTGSGKTAILELAICKLALDRGNENFKIVYQAPTKALCSEKARDWEKKFSHMGLKCAELTGDTSQAEMRRVGDASIIVTTPEKWDSITRKWQDHRRLLQLVELFLIDEVHTLKDVRGATLEAVVSRMKTIGANVRFVALSATVPNSEDIATWLGRNHTNQHLPAHRETFGEEFRPVKLQKLVYGFDSSSNDFIFDKFLDQKLPGLIAKHAKQKPILVFCFTRKCCESTAALLADFASDRPDRDKFWPIPSQRVSVANRELQEIVNSGVAFHHAGLDLQDRVAIEQNFLKGQLGVICCTSTLAVGINLPCHTVVLKGTVGFGNDKLEEYSDLEVMQMLGRAGRPQFDDSATAIILTRSTNKDRYQKMVSGQEILESTLHLNLIGHLNSEICLGTIHNLPSAKTWLGGTFLSVRLRRNAAYYHLTGDMTNPSLVDDKLEEICERDIRQLQDAELVTNQDAFSCTEYGRAMSKYMVEFDTMKLLLQIPRGAGMEVLVRKPPFMAAGLSLTGQITILAQASEFKEFRFKPAERPLFREINQSPLIMYPIKEVVTQTRHKVSLMIQAHLGCVQYPDSSEAAKVRRQLMMERKMVFERLNRLVRAVVDCKGFDRDAAGTRTALELARALGAESWEGRATQLTQVPNIGPVGMRKLASKDIRTVLQLAEREYDEIERLMSRQPPFGKNLQGHLDKFPRLGVDVAVVGHRVQPRSEEPVVIEVKATLRYLNSKGLPNWLNRVPVLTFLAERSDGTLVYFWRGSMRKLDKEAGFDLKFSVQLRDVEDHVSCHFSCEEIVGTIVSKTVRHGLKPSTFPSRPVVASRRNKEYSQESLDDEDLDDADLIMAAEQVSANFSTKGPERAAPVADHDEYPSVEELIEMDDAEQQKSDRFDIHLADHEDEDEAEPAETAMKEPVRLPNGKWQCNHVCAGGAITRSGKPCSHRCCKEGLDKPRRRPVQREKRKRETPAESPVDARPLKPSQRKPQRPASSTDHGPTGIQPKRQKVQTTLSLAPKIGPRPAAPTTIRRDAWKEMDFDDSELECIDLSFTDDEADDIFRNIQATTNTAAGRPLSHKDHRDNMPKVSETTKRNGERGPVVSGQARARDGPKVTNNTTAGVKTVAVSSTHTSGYEDDDFDDDDSCLLDAVRTPKPSTKQAKPTSAFRSGASDETLSREVYNPPTITPRVPGRKDSFGVEIVAGTAAKPDGPTSPLLTKFVGDTTLDEYPTAVASPAGSEMKKVSAGGTNETLEHKAGKADEPDWVAEFDAEFVDMFRGYVTFV